MLENNTCVTRPPETNALADAAVVSTPFVVVTVIVAFPPYPEPAALITTSLIAPFETDASVALTPYVVLE